MTYISNKEELRQLIARYVKGKASSEEVKFLNKYYDHFEDCENGFDDIIESEQSRIKSQIFNEIQKKIIPSRKRIIPVYQVYRVAAVIIFLISIGVVLNTYLKYKNIDVVLDQSSPFVVDTAFGLTKHIYLPDGSYVVLEPGSQLKYSSEFDGVEREVNLKGKAYFDVQPDSLRPFVVFANGVTTRVLGTAFSISSIDNSNEFLISVTRGKVEVLNQSQQLGILEKDDQLILDRVSRKVTKNILREEETAVIEPSEFMMDNMTVAEAIGIVEKRWGCNFDIKNKAIVNCRFTTYFTPTDDLEEVVAVIASVIGAEYNIKNNVVSLDGDGCD